MLKRIPIWALLLFGSLQTALAQVPQPVITKAPALNKTVLACPPGQQNFAGTVSLGTIDAQSNDIDLDTMYLCMFDSVGLVHNGDFDLSGDPDPTSPAGIGYAFYDCPPTISGPDLVTIASDPCVIDPPPPLGNIFVATQGNLNGDIQFFNNGVLIDNFNGGEPAIYWWSPITFDELSVQIIGTDTLYQALYEDNGPCVHANVDTALAVVYLDTIQATNIATGTTAGGCGFSFDVGGGLPQFDTTTNFDITVSLSTDPAVTGTVTSGPAGHGDNVDVLVPEPGLYDVFIEDGKSCGHSFQIDIASCIALTIEIPEAQGLPGETICLPFSVSNFTNIEGLQFSINYDPSVVTFLNTTNYNPAIGNLNGGLFFDVGGAVNFSWASADIMGNTLADGEVFFEVCFEIVGMIGDCSPIEILDTPIPSEVIQNGTGLIDLFADQGEICAAGDLIIADFELDSVSCPGETDGGFTVTLTGGAVPYEVTWQALPAGPVQGPGVVNTQGGSFTAQNLAAGLYEVIVTDNGPAEDLIDTIEVPEGPTLNVIFTNVPPLCNGGLGELTAILVIDSVIVGNPGPNFEFLWSNGETTPTITGINSGLYSVTITDTSTGCTAEGPTFLPQTPPIDIVVDATNPATCSGVPDGSATVSISGGTPDPVDGYEIFWPTVGAGQLDTGFISTAASITSGSYQVLVTDANGCVDSTVVNISAIKELSINLLDQNDVSCNGLCDGSLEIAASTSGGVSAFYVFSWVGNPPVSTPPNNTAITSEVIDLCAGSYEIIVTDDEGCQVSETYDIIEPDPLEVSLLELNNESCDVGNDGSAVLGVTGGVYPYVYTWSDVTLTDSTVNNLTQGTYAVTVTDDNGCEDSLSFDITAPVPPTIISFPNDTLDCSNDVDGALTVIAIPGGASIISYDWSTTQSGPALTTQTDLPPGVYSVTILDAAGCEQIDTAQVVAPLPITIDSFTTTSPLCPGDGGGSISVFVSGGTPPYFYDWPIDNFDGFGISAIGGPQVTAGTYTVEVSDINNCPVATVDIVVSDPPTIEVDFTAVDSVSCFDSQGVPCDGTATAAAMYSDGTTGNFNFFWDSGETDLGVMSSTAIELCQDFQGVTVSDGTCSVDTTIFIPSPEALELALVEIDDVTCFGFDDGSATVSAQGGTAPYSFTWSNMDMGPTVTGLAAGTYGMTIEDSKGCLFQTTLPVDEPAPLVGFVDPQNTVDSVTCAGDTDGVITVGANGGNLNQNPTLIYAWSGGVAPSNSNTATNLAAGTYTVTISDFLGCSDEVTYTINEPLPITFDLGSIEPIPCADSSTVIVIDTVFGGNGGNLFFYSFSVDNAAPQPIGTAIEVFGGEHLIEVFDLSGCSEDTLLNLVEPAPIILNYPDYIVELGDSTVLAPDQFFSEFPIDQGSIFWTPTTDLTFFGDSLQPLVRPFDSQLYTIEAMDINGCPIVTDVFVEVDKNRNIYIPNIFTPDNDGLNDYFHPFAGNGVRIIRTMNIFDRWGELMYAVQNIPPSNDIDPDNGWDGTFRGKRLNAGVFVYIIEVEFEDGQVLLYRGDVTLIR